MARIRSNWAQGLVSDNPLTSTATTLNSAALADFPLVASPNVAFIVLNPDQIGGAREVVKITSHALSATSATIERGQEGTVGVEHDQNTPWRQTVLESDILSAGAIIWSDLVTPIYIAHRGGGSVYPENTLEAFRAVVDVGLQSIETDVHRLHDGGLGIMHDSTVDRTTTATGNVADFTTAAYQNLIVDAGSWHQVGGPYGNLSMPLFSDVVREFGGKVVLWPEVKNQAAGPLMAELIARRNLPLSVIPLSFVSSWLEPLQDIGCATAIIDASAATSAATHIANGHTWVACDRASAPQANVDAYIIAGLKVLIYNISKHTDRDTWLSRGVHAFASDDPVYLSATATSARHRATTDPFASKAYWHGQHIGNVSRGAFSGTNEHGFDSVPSATNEFVMWGWAAPSAGADITIDFTLKFPNIQGAANWGGLYVGLDDTKFANQTSAWGGGGYLGRIETDGTLRLHRIQADGTSTQIGSNVETSSISAGGTCGLKMTVSATQLKWERTTATTGNITSTNADALAHRPSAGKGWYPWFGRSGTSQQAMASAVTIS